MQTVIFVDIDSTIVENRFSRKAIGTLLREIASATGQPVEAILKELSTENTRRQRTNPDHPLTMDWDDIVNTIADKHGVTLTSDVMTLWQENARAEDVELIDNSPDVIRRLKAPHRQLVIATKGLSKYQNPVLEVTGMRDLFDDMLTPDITGYLKTSPGYFARYFAMPDETLFIQLGDHYYDDVICARSNGFYPILRVRSDELAEYDPFERPQYISQIADSIHTFPDEGTDVRPEAVVVSLLEVPAVVTRLEARHHYEQENPDTDG